VKGYAEVADAFILKLFKQTEKRKVESVVSDDL
jgi:hypothetical protein